MPSSLEPSRFYKSCLSYFQDLHTKFGSLPDDLSCKNLYSLLHELPEVTRKCTGFWESGLSRPMNWCASVWRKLRFKLIENCKNDLIWLIIHRIVRTRGAHSHFTCSVSDCVILFIPIKQLGGICNKCHVFSHICVVN